jgi:predicted ATPase
MLEVERWTLDVRLFPTGMTPTRAKRIVLTGGPGAGKTVIARHLVASYPHHFVLVPEAATQVYAALNTRWDRLDLEGQRDAQRQIYHLQRQQEDRLQSQHPAKILLLDRGTIDGAAYWPDGPDAYWKDLGTTHQTELNRYDIIIWLQTAAALGLYDGDASNTCRFEDPEAAVKSGQLLTQLWGSHPRMQRVDAYPDLPEKIAAVERTLWQAVRLPPLPSKA